MKAWKIWLFSLALVVAVIALALGGAILNRKAVAGWALQRVLASQGIAHAEITVTKLDPDGAQFIGVRLPDEHIEIDRIDVDYSFGDALDGKFKTIRIIGLRASVDIAASSGPGDSAVEFGFDPAPLQEMGAKIDVNDAVLTLTSGGEMLVRLLLKGNGDFAAAEPPVAVTLETVEINEGLPLRSLRLEAAGTATKAAIAFDGRLAARVADWSAAGWRIDDVDYDGPVRVRIAPADLSLEMAASTHLNLTRLAQSKAEEDIALSGETGTVTLSAAWADGLTSRTHLAGAQLEVAAWALAVNDIEADLPLSAAGLFEMGSASGVLSALGKAPVFTPMAFDVQVSPVANRLVMGGAVAPVGKQVRIDLSGYFEPETGIGNFSIKAPSIPFAPKKLQPTDFSATLLPLTDVDGPVALSANAHIDPKSGLTTGAVLTFLKVNASAAGAGFKGLEGTVTLTDLFNPRTPPKQTLKAALLTAPIPMERPEFTFQLKRGGADPLIQIDRAVAVLAGGQVSLEPVAFRPLAANNDLALIIDKIDLKPLLKDWAAEKLSGTGLISGRIPVLLRPSGVIIPAGGVKAENPGVLQVHWGDMRNTLTGQGREVSLLVQVLEDFHYKILEVGIDRPEGAQLGLQVRLEGMNPAVLDGYPFNLNIGLSGNLETMLAALAKGQSLTMNRIGGQLGATK